jgi:hypothetical protein
MSQIVPSQRFKVLSKERQAVLIEKMLQDHRTILDSQIFQDKVGLVKIFFNENVYLLILWST